MTVLEAKDLTKVYGSRGKVTTRALNNLSLTVDKGEFVGVMGPSGSGKTTLLNLLATIDKPTSGTILLDGQNLAQMRGNALALFRRQRLGFVFQDFNLLDTLTLGENICLPLVLDGQRPAIINQRLKSTASQLGLNDDLLKKYPYEVSGGQQQRAAAARAVIHEPAIVLADEPTGNLDSKAARELMEMLSVLHNVSGVTIVLVTHDPAAASYCERILFIRDGQLYNEIRRGDSRQVFYQQILDVLALIGGGNDEFTNSGY